MNVIDVLFRTDRFNLSKVGEHFINPCCFGEDVAAWLRPILASKGVETSSAYQEDWGWEVPVRLGNAGYYLCISGNSDEVESNQDRGEWRVIIEKRRSLWQLLSGRGKIAADDGMVRLIEGILSSEPGIEGVRRGA